MKSTGYFTKIATWKAGKYLKIWERKTRDQEFACLLACLADTEKGTCCKSLLKTVFPFFTNQAMKFCSHSIVGLILSREFHMAIL